MDLDIAEPVATHETKESEWRKDSMDEKPKLPAAPSCVHGTLLHHRCLLCEDAPKSASAPKEWVLQGIVLRTFKGPALNAGEYVHVIEKSAYLYAVDQWDHFVEQTIQLREKVARIEKERDHNYASAEKWKDAAIEFQLAECSECERLERELTEAKDKIDTLSYHGPSDYAKLKAENAELRAKNKNQASTIADCDFESVLDLRRKLTAARAEAAKLRKYIGYCEYEHPAKERDRYRALLDSIEANSKTPMFIVTGIREALAKEQE